MKGALSWGLVAAGREKLPQLKYNNKEWEFTVKEQGEGQWVENCSQKTSEEKKNPGYTNLAGFLLKEPEGDQTSPQRMRLNIESDQTWRVRDSV